MVGRVSGRRRFFPRIEMFGLVLWTTLELVSGFLFARRASSTHPRNLRTSLPGCAVCCFFGAFLINDGFFFKKLVSRRRTLI